MKKKIEKISIFHEEKVTNQLLIILAADFPGMSQMQIYKHKVNGQRVG